MSDVANYDGNDICLQCGQPVYNGIQMHEVCKIHKGFCADTMFIPSGVFIGSQAGYVYKSGKFGMGYYIDTPSETLISSAKSEMTACESALALQSEHLAYLLDYNRDSENWNIPEDMTVGPFKRDLDGNLVSSTPFILDMFQRELAKYHFRDSELLPPNMKFVFLERWLHSNPWLYQSFKKSVKTSVLPKKLYKNEVGTILAIVHMDGTNQQRLVSFLHVNLNADRSENWRPPDFFTYKNRLYADPETAYNIDCYIANSATPHECDQRKGFNTILRKMVISAASYIGLGRVISSPFSGAYSNGILDKLGFLTDRRSDKEQGNLRYLPLKVVDPYSEDTE